jgi:hypothetical protein
MIKIRNYFKKIYHAIIGTPKWKMPTDSPISFAFSWDGEDYYCFENPFNMPWQRAYVALAYYEELNMRITKDFLLDIILVIKEHINSPKPEITEIVRYLNMIEDRTKFIVEPETLLKLASVYYFTKDESPVYYDLVYNSKKIAKWRKTRTLDFFLQLPVRELAPLLTLSRETFQVYLTGQLSQTIKMIDEMLKVLSQDESRKSNVEELKLQRARLIELWLSVSES